MNRCGCRCTRYRRRRLTAINVETFDAPPGHVAFTLDVAGAAPVSVCIPIAELEGLMSDFTHRADGAQLDDLEWHARARICIAEMFMTGGADYKENAALIGFWLTLNHPATNADLKRKLSEQIRDHDCAHVTMAIGPSGMMSTAVSDSFVDLDSLLAAAARSDLAVPISIVAAVASDTADLH